MTAPRETVMTDADPTPWSTVDTAPDGVEVETRILDDQGERNVQRMTRRGRLWFAGEMYVYYAPTHWRPL